ncbi:MAG: hypothetical protein ACSLEL_05410 [Candidatus Malihini olakiniferum]
MLADELCSLLTNKQKGADFFDTSLIKLNFSTDSLLMPQTLNAGRLKQFGTVDAGFSLGQLKLLYLGKECDLTDNAQGDLSSNCFVFAQKAERLLRVNTATLLALLTSSLLKTIMC